MSTLTIYLPLFLFSFRGRHSVTISVSESRISVLSYVPSISTSTIFLYLLCRHSSYWSYNFCSIAMFQSHQTSHYFRLNIDMLKIFSNVFESLFIFNTRTSDKTHILNSFFLSTSLNGQYIVHAQGIFYLFQSLFCL